MVIYGQLIYVYIRVYIYTMVNGSFVYARLAIIVSRSSTDPAGQICGANKNTPGKLDITPLKSYQNPQKERRVSSSSPIMGFMGDFCC